MLERSASTLQALHTSFLNVFYNKINVVTVYKQIGQKCTVSLSFNYTNIFYAKYCEKSTLEIDSKKKCISIFQLHRCIYEKSNRLNCVTHLISCQVLLRRIIYLYKTNHRISCKIKVQRILQTLKWNCSLVQIKIKVNTVINVITVLLGLAAAQDSNYHIRNNYHDNDKQSPSNDERRPSPTTPIPILHWNKQQEHDGTYKTSYETGNNIIAEESGYIKKVGDGEDQGEALVQQGSYSYTSPEGKLITIHYTADETGFHATGDHIPTPPPVSEEIQKGLDLIFAGIRQQEEAQAREAAQKAQQQPLNQQIDRRDNHAYKPQK
ncbi:cuticular protein 49Ah [Calliopsis andreniformis]|uniref:cuticular protein 49Ah n=1 Tax=Calliopsis andreniformis TaxID=337506 RepID=UPI003FCEACDA